MQDTSLGEHVRAKTAADGLVSIQRAGVGPRESTATNMMAPQFPQRADSGFVHAFRPPELSEEQRLKDMWSNKSKLYRSGGLWKEKLRLQKEIGIQAYNSMPQAEKDRMIRRLEKKFMREQRRKIDSLLAQKEVEQMAEATRPGTNTHAQLKQRLLSATELAARGAQHGYTMTGALSPQLADGASMPPQLPQRVKSAVVARKAAARRMPATSGPMSSENMQMEHVLSSDLQSKVTSRRSARARGETTNTVKTHGSGAVSLQIDSAGGLVDV